MHQEYKHKPELDNSDEDQLLSDAEEIENIKMSKTKGRIKRADAFLENHAINECIEGIAAAHENVKCRSVIW